MKAQFGVKNNFEPTNYFYVTDYHLQFIYKNDSLFTDFEDFTFIERPKLPGSARISNLATISRYKLVDGKCVELSQIGDSIILFKQGKSFEGFPWDIDYSGELVINSTNYVVFSDIPLTDAYGESMVEVGQNGELVNVYPKEYALVPNGLWYHKIDSLKYEMGNFEMGKKEGVWNVYNGEIISNRAHVILETKEFSEGKLIETNNMNFLPRFNQKELKSFIEGEWYNYGIQSFELSYYREKGFIYYVFSRDSSDMMRSYYKMLDYINFKPNGTFDKKTSASCGVGFKGNEDDRVKEWYFDKNGQLIIDGYIYHVIYLNEKQLVLRVDFAED